MRNIIDLAGDLGLQVVAEGVEDRLSRRLSTQAMEGFTVPIGLPSDSVCALWSERRSAPHIRRCEELATHLRLLATMI